MRITPAKVAAGGVMLVVMLLVAGCGSPTPFGSPPARHATAGEGAVHDPELGNLQTLDACSLIPPGHLSFWSGLARPDLQVTQGGTFSSCELLAELSARSVDIVELDVDAVSSPSALAKNRRVSIVRHGHLRVVTPHRQPKGECYFGALTSADTYLTAAAFSEGVGGSSALCTLAKAAIDDVVATVGAKKVGHFAWPHSSMGSVEACSLASVKQMAKAFPGVDRSRSGPDGHSCRYTVGASTAGVTFETVLTASPDTLRSQRRLWAETGGTYPGKTETIDGRATLVGPLLGPVSTGGTLCEAETTGRRWSHGFGNDTAPLPDGASTPARLYEVPTVVVGGHGDLGSACTVAATVARTIWPELQPGSR